MIANGVVDGLRILERAGIIPHGVVVASGMGCCDPEAETPDVLDSAEVGMPEDTVT